jgi:hypothetical protein
MRGRRAAKITGQQNCPKDCGSRIDIDSRANEQQKADADSHIRTDAHLLARFYYRSNANYLGNSVEKPETAQPTR